MKLLILSRTKNYVVSVDLSSFKSQNKMIDPSKKPVGFSCMTRYKDKIIMGTVEGSCIYIADTNLEGNIEKVYVGASVRDIKTYKDKALLLCHDINALIVYDLSRKRFLFEIPTGDYPFSFTIDEENNKICICSLLEEKVTIFDGDDYKVIYEISGITNPTDVLCINNKVYVLENKFDSFKNGNLIIIDSSDTLRKMKKIKVSKSPVYMIYDKNNIYILDIESGAIHIVDIKEEVKIDKKYDDIGLMPIKMTLYNNNFYVLDYFTGSIVQVNKDSGKTKNIAKVDEPSAMLIL